MRIILVLLSCCFVFFSASSVMAFDSSGMVNDYVSYSNLQVTQYRYSLKVSGTLESNSDKTMSVSGSIRFLDIDGNRINSACISKSIPPFGTVDFDLRLSEYKINETNDAYEVVWSVR